MSRTSTIMKNDSVSSPLPTNAPTNNLAEVLAIHEGLEEAWKVG